MAFRAGARIRDLEFVQFHPTTLYVAGAARHLITEAVRGEGGKLVDEKGERFAFQYHPAGELAPRDVVSRAIVSHLGATETSCAYLDLSHLGERATTRFPGLTRVCALYNIDVRKAGSRCCPRRTTRSAASRSTWTDARTFRPLRRGRGRLERAPRREPACEQLAARGPRIWPPRGRARRRRERAAARRAAPGPRARTRFPAA